MKGIVLAGGLGTRLRPLTTVVSKQLLPVYDKPMIYYPMATLLRVNTISDIAIISTPTALPQFQELLGSGDRFGVNLTYIPQAEPKGIAEAFLLAEDFIGDDYVTLILGDNIFHGYDETITACLEYGKGPTGAKIFGYRVSDPSKYGVAAFDDKGSLVRIKEKPLPAVAPSDVAITGLYQYGEGLIEKTKSLQPSHRGELEITDLNNLYIREGTCSLYTLSGAWLDMGSPEGLLQASNYVQTIQERQGTQIACLEEIVFRQKRIGLRDLELAIDFHLGTKYNEYLQKVLKDGNC
jgi:glucose-1-phosphate thymidylyltransferase